MSRVLHHEDAAAAADKAMTIQNSRAKHLYPQSLSGIMRLVAKPLTVTVRMDFSIHISTEILFCTFDY